MTSGGISRPWHIGVRRDHPLAIQRVIAIRRWRATGELVSWPWRRGLSPVGHDRRGTEEKNETMLKFLIQTG